MDLRLSITCPSCRRSFRTARQRIREGVTLYCSNCHKPVRIDPISENSSVRRVLNVARRIEGLVNRLRPAHSAKAELRKRRAPKRRRSGVRVRKVVRS
jgi:hypothetical protein